MNAEWSAVAREILATPHEARALDETQCRLIERCTSSCFDLGLLALGVMAEVYNERLPEDVRAELCAAAQAMEDALRVLAAQSLPGPHTGWQREAKVVG